MSNYQGIILKVKDYKEYDKILTCLLEKIGKVNIILESSKKNTDYSLTEPMCLVDVAVTKVPNTDCLYYLYQGKQIRGYKNIRTSQLKVAYSMYFFSLVNNLIDYCEHEYGVYDHLKNYLNLFDLIEERNLAQYNTYMSLKLLKVLGLGEVPKWCFECDQEFKTFINVDNKGLTYCDNCIEQNKHVKISKDKWESLVETKVTNISNLKLSTDEVKAIELYIMGLIGKEIEGYQYLNLIRN
jgi:DNA repair protein RecO